MPDDKIPMNPGSGGKDLASSSFTHTVQGVIHREHGMVTGVLEAEIARVLNVDPSLTAYALAVRALIMGNVAHGVVDAGAPVKFGGVAIAHGVNPAAVAVAARSDLYMNRHGIPFFIGGHPNVKTFSVVYTAAETNTIIINPTAGTKIIVTQCQARLSDNVVGPVDVLIGLHAATTPTGNGVVLRASELGKNVPVTSGNGSGIVAIAPVADDDLLITSTVPNGGKLDVSVSYFEVES